MADAVTRVALATTAGELGISGEALRAHIRAERSAVTKARVNREARLAREAKKPKRALGAVAEKTRKRCALDECAKPFETDNPKRIYCQPRCRHRAKWLNEKERLRKAGAKPPSRVAERAAELEQLTGY